MNTREREKAINENRWWVDTTEEKVGPQRPKPVTKVGERLFAAGRGFDQETAHSQLTDFNLKLLEEAAVLQGGWSYIATSQARSRKGEVAKVKRQLPLPPTVRGLIVDCGHSLRLLITGKPIGNCILEFRLGREPCFDCWLDGEWIDEKVFRNSDEALRRARLYIKRYFG